MAAIVILAAAAAIWVFAETKLNKRRLDVSVVRVEELTKFRRVPHLKGNFVYNGQPVDRLWEVGIVINNSGKDTLVGVGDKKDLIGDSLVFGFLKGETIIDYFEEDNEPDVDLRTINGNCFRISFKQWRPNEEYSLSFYISTGPNYRHTPTPVVISKREIIGGEIRVLPLTVAAEEKTGRDSLIKWSGFGVAAISVIAGFLFSIATKILLRRSEEIARREKSQRNEGLRLLEKSIGELGVTIEGKCASEGEPEKETPEHSA